MQEYTAIVKRAGGWWIGWIEEVPGVNCQERSREELLETLTIALGEALEFNRQAALAAAGPDPDYRGQIEALEKTTAHLARAARACLYVLHRTRAGSEGDREAPAVLDFRLLGEARRAFEGLHRAGFERSAPGDPRLASAHAALAARLPAVIERVGGVLRTLDSSERWVHAEAEDRPVFAGAFARLYATARAEAAGSASFTGPRGRGRKGHAPGRHGEATEGAPASKGEHP